jgi:hypothetical protein
MKHKTGSKEDIMKNFLLAIGMVLLMAGMGWAVAGGPCTDGRMFQYDKTPTGSLDMQVIQLDILSKSDGSLTGGANCQIISVKGAYIDHATVTPDTGGTAPATVYNCRVNQGSLDIMQGELRSLPIAIQSDGTDGSYHPLIGGVAKDKYIYDDLSVVCDTMGNAKGTTIDLYFYREN